MNQTKVNKSINKSIDQSTLADREPKFGSKCVSAEREPIRGFGDRAPSGISAQVI